VTNFRFQADLNLLLIDLLHRAAKEVAKIEKITLLFQNFNLNIYS